jgi:hypothetical protein
VPVAVVLADMQVRVAMVHTVQHLPMLLRQQQDQAAAAAVGVARQQPDQVVELVSMARGQTVLQMAAAVRVAQMDRDYLLLIVRPRHVLAAAAGQHLSVHVPQVVAVCGLCGVQVDHSLVQQE